ncbi:MAG: ATP synthase subunit I [Clostridium sp.]
MHKENRLLLKSVLKYNLFLASIVTLIAYLFIDKLSVFFPLGLFLAYVNLVINTIALNKFVSKDNSNLKNILIISKIVRVILVATISMLIIRFTKIGFIIFILGYTSQMISFIFYGNEYKNN